MKQLRTALPWLLALVVLSMVVIPAAYAADPKPLVPDCQADLPPNEGGCGIDSFIQLIKNIIEYMTIIVIPIMVLLIGYAGFLVMTSGGNQERASQGWKMIKIAIIGIAIIGVSYLVVKFVFDALDVPSEFRPGGL
jgi:hypothetical protein